MISSDYIKELGRLMLGYLPAVYSKDAESEEFLERFLGIYGSEIIKNEEIIGQIPTYFDPMALTEEEAKDFLRWLAGWLSLDLFDHYSSKNRDYLLKAAEFYRKKGTEAGLISMLEFFTDRKVDYIRDKRSTVLWSYNKSLVDRYHPVSLTVDTDDRDLIGKMGTKDDTVHYIYDGGSSDRRDSFHTVDIYLKARQPTSSKETDKEIKDKRSIVLLSYNESLADSSQLSLTIDTNDKDLIGKMGTKDDKVHYIYDDGRGCQGDTIDLKLKAGQSILFEEAKRENEKLMTLLEPFLPALMRVNILEL